MEADPLHIPQYGVFATSAIVSDIGDSDQGQVCIYILVSVCEYGCMDVVCMCVCVCVCVCVCMHVCLFANPLV